MQKITDEEILELCGILVKCIRYQATTIPYSPSRGATYTDPINEFEKLVKRLSDRINNPEPKLKFEKLEKRDD